MADTVSRQWIYPPNWDGESHAGDGSAIRTDGFNPVGHRSYILKIKGYSDGSGMDARTMLNIAHLRDSSGRIACRTVIEKIEFRMYGVDAYLYWETDPSNEPIAYLPGTDSIVSHGTIYGPLIDPRTGDGTDGSGNILLTINGATSGDTYDIILYIKPKSSIRWHRNIEEFRI